MFKSFAITTHKFFELHSCSRLGGDTLEVYLLAFNPLEFSLNWSHKQDHAGIRFTFSIYKLFFIEIAIYDHRHWDYMTNDWEVCPPIG